MKKIITLILLLTINLFYAQVQRLDSLMNETQTYKQVLSYDNNGNCLSLIEQRRDTANDSWEGTDGIYCSYNNNQVVSLTKREWHFRNKTVFAYTNGVKTSGVIFKYDWNNDQWFEVGTATYSYNTNDKLIEEIRNYNEVILSSGEHLSYDGDIKYEHIYNSSDQKTNWKQFRKNSSTNNQWELQREKVYTYNSENLLSLITDIYDGQNKTELTYNTDGNLIEEVGLFLDDQTNNWTYSSKYTYTYDNSVSEGDMLLPNNYILSYLFDNDYYTFNNKVTNVNYFEWNNGANDWDDEGVLNWYYSDTALSTNNIDIHNYTVYPNPTTNQVKFDITDFEKIEIYDITGKLITKTETNIVNMENIPNGTYLYRIQKGNETINGKIIKK